MDADQTEVVANQIKDALERARAHRDLPAPYGWAIVVRPGEGDEPDALGLQTESGTTMPLTAGLIDRIQQNGMATYVRGTAVGTVYVPHCLLHLGENDPLPVVGGYVHVVADERGTGASVPVSWDTECIEYDPVVIVMARRPEGWPP